MALAGIGLGIDLLSLKELGIKAFFNRFICCGGYGFNKPYFGIMDNLVIPCSIKGDSLCCGGFSLLLVKSFDIILNHIKKLISFTKISQKSHDF